MALVIAVGPSLLTMTGVGIVVALAMKEDWLVALLTGLMLNGLSPAVIIPLMLRLIGTGQGAKKRIPQSIITGATFEDIFVILLFGILFNIVVNDIGTVHISIGMSILTSFY